MGKLILPVSCHHLGKAYSLISFQETVLPLAFETQLSGPKSLLGKAAAKINFIQTMGKEIVGSPQFFRPVFGLTRLI